MTYSSKNKTLTLTEDERKLYLKKVLYPNQSPLSIKDILNKTICADINSLLDILPNAFVDLLILDPPYNLDKNFHGFKFSKISDTEYENYFESWFSKIIKTLKNTSSIYVCGDFKNACAIYNVLKKYTTIQNKIVWQREKGRGTNSNWKNSYEDIWFATVSKNYYFDVNAVKQRRKVLAPYRDDGIPKDWQETKGSKFRDTYPSNFWDDISIPFWSMFENTEHPTQKPEKLFAKLILASSKINDVILDPFLGSGTSSVVCKKLGRQYIGVDFNPEYCAWAEKRLDAAELNGRIQGYEDKVFWERNTGFYKKNLTNTKK